MERDQASARQGDAGGAQVETGGGARRRAQEKMLAVLFDLGLGHRVEVDENIGPGTVVSGCQAPSWGEKSDAMKSIV
jgi:hypothetical protein